MAASDSAPDHGDHFGKRMSVWRHLEIGWKLDALDDYVSRLRGVANQGRNLDIFRKAGLFFQVKLSGINLVSVSCATAGIESAIKLIVATRSFFMRVLPNLI